MYRQLVSKKTSRHNTLMHDELSNKFYFSSFFLSSLFGKHKIKSSFLSPPDFQHQNSSPYEHHRHIGQSVNSDLVLGKFFERIKYSARSKKKKKSFSPSPKIPDQFVPGLFPGIRTKYFILKPISSPSVRTIVPTQQHLSKSPVQKKVRSQPAKTLDLDNIRTNKFKFAVMSKPLATNTLSLSNLNQVLGMHIFNNT